MSELFINILNMSISAGWTVAAVLILRFLLKKTRVPKQISVFLWGIVAIRLVCPFSFESVLSLIPSAETVTPDIMTSPAPAIDSGVEIIDSLVNPVIESSFAPSPSYSANPLQIQIPVFAVIWLLGIVGMLLYTAISYLKLKRKIGTAVKLYENIYQSEFVVSPFVLGLVKPKIYLPFNLSEHDREYVTAHEKAHIRRKDHWWKPLGFLLLSIHWFNPLMWVSYVLLCRDIELACDERVIKEMNAEQKADYSQTLLNCSVNRRIIAACPLAFGETDVKTRVKSVLNYKKPSFWIIVAALAASIILGICFLTNPKTDSFGFSNGQSSADINGVSLEIISADLTAPDPILEIKITNDTDNTLYFGNEFECFYYSENAWENTAENENAVWNLPVYTLNAHSTATRVFSLNGQIMSRTGQYRMEIPFDFNEKAEFSHKAWIEFTLDTAVEGVSVHTFEVQSIVYDDSMYSYAQSDDISKTYMLVNGMQLLEKSPDGSLISIGYFERTKLNANNFDSRFTQKSGESWLADEKLNSLKAENARMWQMYASSEDGESALYILLRQTDGTYYLGYGYYNLALESSAEENTDSSHIRWLYKLEKIPTVDSTVGGSDSSNILTFESALSFANYTESSELYVCALNRNKLSVNSVRHLPVYKFDSSKELDGFKKTFGDVFTMDSGWDEIPSFNSITAKYDSEFFENNSLILIYIAADNSTHRFEVQNIYIDGGSFLVHISENTKAEETDSAMSGWFVTVAVSKEYIAACNEFDADLIG